MALRRLHYVGHATVLLLTEGGRTILSDPWILDSPGLTHAPPVARSVGELPRLDVITISHFHNDHFNPETLAALASADSAATIITMAETRNQMRSRLIDLGFSKIVQLAHGESFESNGLRVTALWSHDRTTFPDPWRREPVEQCTFLYELEGSVVFAGTDMMENEDLFRAIAARHAVDVAFLPTSGWLLPGSPRVRDVMGPAEASAAAGILNPRIAVPYAAGDAEPRQVDLATWRRLGRESSRDKESLVVKDSYDEFVRITKKDHPSIRALHMKPGDDLPEIRGKARYALVPSFVRDGRERVSKDLMGRTILDTGRQKVILATDIFDLLDRIDGRTSIAELAARSGRARSSETAWQQEIYEFLSSLDLLNVISLNTRVFP